MVTCEDCVKWLCGLHLRVDEIDAEAWDIHHYKERLPEDIRREKWDRMYRFYRGLSVLTDTIKPCIPKKLHEKLVKGVLTIDKGIHERNTRKVFEGIDEVTDALWDIEAEIIRRCIQKKTL